MLVAKARPPKFEGDIFRSFVKQNFKGGFFKLTILWVVYLSYMWNVTEPHPERK